MDFLPVAWLTRLLVIYIQVASRYGITGWPVFQGAMRASRMRHWVENGEKFVFRVTFVTTLMLAAFVHF